MKTRSTTCAGGQHRKATPAVLAGYHPGFLEMIAWGFVHNSALCNTRGAPEPDNVPGSGTHHGGM